MNSIYTAGAEELESCPVCAGRELAVLQAASDVHAYITTGSEFVFRLGLTGCARCGFMFENPRPGQAELGRYYGLQARKPRSFANLDKPYAALLDFQTGFIRKRWRPAGRQRILDIGSAEGFFLKRLAAECEASPLLEGIEPSSVYADAARELMPDAVMHEQLLETTKLDEQSYDLITLRHVLEHLLEPLEAIKHARRLLKPTGLLHIEVPDVTDMPASITPFLNHEHINYFTPATLRLALEFGGFRVLEHEWGNDNPPGSGFAYPIQRVLAEPAAGASEPDSIVGRHQAPNAGLIYEDYQARYRGFIARQFGTTRERLLALSSAGKRIGLFGAGPHAFEMLRVLELPSSFFSFAVDNSPLKQGKKIRGIGILAPTRDTVSQLDAILVSSAEFEGAMVEQLESYDLPSLEIIRLYNRDKAAAADGR
jgi:SAM-dependent methyltransferase